MPSTKNKIQISKKVNKLCLSVMSKTIKFQLGKNATYKMNILLKTILFCAMRGLYFESGLEEFANRIKQKVPNADTINRRIKQKSNQDILNEFMEIQNKIFSKLRRMRLIKGRAITLIDITEIPYWGNKNDKGIMGTKKQKGTSYCYKYISIHLLIKNHKVCVHALPVIPFSNKAKLVDELLKYAKKKVRIGIVLMDREFANSKIIPVIEKHELKYLAPITKNIKIYKIIKTLYWIKRKFNCDEICNYEFKNGVSTKLFFTLNKKKEFSTKITERFFSWCTNADLDVENREFLAKVYGRRWNIENFYRDGKGNFLIKTKSKIFCVRLFFFLFCAILYNIWQIIKMVKGVVITAQKWKTSVFDLLYSKSKLWFDTTIYEHKSWNDVFLGRF